MLRYHVIDKIPGLKKLYAGIVAQKLADLLFVFAHSLLRWPVVYAGMCCCKSRNETEVQEQTIRAGFFSNGSSLDGLLNFLNLQPEHK